MAKVTGPLLSLDARGKIADAIVFSAWKGVKYVRQWLKPSNPQSAAQGDIRVVMGGLGRGVAEVKTAGTFYTKLVALGVMPSNQSQQSYLVQYIKDHYIAGGGATMTGAFVSMLAELTGHTSSAQFGTIADNLGVTEFDLTYASIVAFDKRLAVYLLAKAAIAIGFTGAPYATALASWTAAETTVFESHLSG